MYQYRHILTRMRQGDSDREINAAARQGYDVLFITQTQLMASLRTAQAMGAYERRLQYLSKVALLIIDDIRFRAHQSVTAQAL